MLKYLRSMLLLSFCYLCTLHCVASNNEVVVSKVIYDKNDQSIALYLRYGYNDSLQFIRDQVALNAYPYADVVDYKSGGTTQNGWDCSGFIQYLYAQFQIKLPRTAAEMSKLGLNVDLEKLTAGDLLFFGSEAGVTHVAMVFQTDNGVIKIIHCTSSAGVIIDRFDDLNWKDYWSKRYLFSKRVIGT